MIDIFIIIVETVIIKIIIVTFFSDGSFILKTLFLIPGKYIPLDADFLELPRYTGRSIYFETISIDFFSVND
jgi:hypothetical protein